MAEFTGDLRDAHIWEADLTGARLEKVQLNDARLRMVDLSGAVLRGVGLAGTAIDGELWELEGLTINGVEVVPLIEAELLRRDPVRSLLQPTDRDELLTVWDALEQSWAATVAQADALPAGGVDVSVEQEWSFTQTLRHLVSVTDIWLGGAIQADPRPCHPWALPFTDLPEFLGAPASSLGIDEHAAPTYDEVLPVRAERQAMVRTFLERTTPEQLATEVTGPPWTDGPLSVLRCLRVIVNEEYEHRRFAERDLALLTARK